MHVFTLSLIYHYFTLFYREHRWGGEKKAMCKIPCMVYFAVEPQGYYSDFLFESYIWISHCLIHLDIPCT